MMVIGMKEREKDREKRERERERERERDRLLMSLIKKIYMYFKIF